MHMDKVKLVLHVLGFVLINTVCAGALLGYETTYDTAALACGLTLWVWSDSIKVKHEAN